MKNNSSISNYHRIAGHTLDVLNDSVFWLDSEAHFYMVNKGMCKNLGYSEEELLKMTFYEIDPEYPKDKWNKNWAMLNTREELVFESSQKRKDGTSFPVEIRGQRITFEGKDYLYATVRDIVEHKRNEESLKKSETKYKMLFDEANDAIFIMEGEKFIECNAKTLVIFGVQKAEEIIGLSPWEFSPKIQPDGMDSYYKAKSLIKKTREGEAQKFYWKHTKADGAEFDAEVSLNRLEFGKKKNVLHAIVRDITDLVTIKDALTISEASARALINATEDSALLIDPSSRIIELNDASSKKLGKDREKLIGITGFDEMPEKLASYRKQRIDQLLQTKKPVKYDTEWESRHYTTNIYPILDKDGEVMQIAVFERDVTEDKKREEAIRESQATARALLNAPTDTVILIETDGTILELNEAATISIGKKQEELIGINVFDLFPPEVSESRRAKGQEVIKTRAPLRFMDTRNGRYFENSLYPIFNDKGDVNKIAVFSRDITEEQKVIDTLKESEEKFHKAFSNNPDPIHITTIPDGIFIDVNSEFEKISGYSRDELIGAKVDDLDFYANPSDREEAFQRLYKEGRLHDYEILFRVKSGDIRICRVFSEIIEYQGRKHLLTITHDITEQEEAEEALRQSEEKYRTLSENNLIGIWQIDDKGTTKYVNPAMSGILEISGPEEILGESFRSFFRKESLSIIDKELGKRKKGIASSYEIEIIGKKGTERCITLAGAPILSDTGKYQGSIGTCTDITERKLAEKALQESEERLRAFMNSATDSFYLLDNEMNFIMVNKTGLKIMKRELKNVVGKNIKEIVPDIVTSGRYAKHQEVLQTGKSFMIEDFIPNPVFGEKHFIVESFKVGNGLGVISIDITERKKAEKALQASEEKFRSMIETSPDAVTTSDLDGKLTYVSQKTAEIHGYEDPEELLGMNALDLFVPEDRQIAFENIGKTMVQGLIRDVEYGLLRKDGSSFDGELSGSLIKDIQGNPSGIIAITKDITDRKNAEKALQESEKRYRLLIENIPNVVWKTDKNGISSFISNNVEKVYGYAPKQIYEEGSKLWFDRIHPDDKEKIREAFTLLFEKGYEYNVEYRIQKKDGKWIWLNDRASGIYDENGEYYAYGVFSDISARKKVEEALQESEIKYRSLFDDALDMIHIVDTEGKIIDVNKIELEKMQYKKEEYIGKKLSDFIHPDNLTDTLNKLKKVYHGEPSLMYKTAFVKKDGEKIDVEVSAFPEVKDDKIVSARGILRDITEKTKTDEALKESEIRFRTLAESAFDGIVISEKGLFVETSEQFEQMFGYEKSELYGKPVMDLVAPESRNLVKEKIKSGFKKTYEHMAIHKDGTVFPVEVSGRSIPYRGRKSRITAIKDIRDRKKAENIIKESEERLKVLFEFAPDAIYLNDLRGHFIDGNKASERLLGYKREELIGKNLLKFSLLPKDQLGKAAKALTKNVARKPTGPDEFTLKRKDGTEVVVEIRTYPVKIKDQIIVMGMARDISDRKKAEEALKYSEHYLKEAQAMALLGNWKLDIKNSVVTGSEELFHIFCLNRKENSLEVFAGVVHPDDREYFLYHIQRGIDHGESWDIEHRFVCKDGTKKIVQVKGEAVRDSKGRIVELVGTVQDITSWKKVEEQLKLSEDKFSKAYQSSPIAMAITTVDEGKVIDVNSSFERIFGFSKADILNKTALEAGLHINDSERQKLVKLLKSDGRITDMEARYRNSAGEIRICNLSAEVISVGNENLILSVVEDITDVRDAEKIRETYENNLKTLASELTLTEARERQNIASDLHDNLGQSLAVTKFALARLNKSIVSQEGRKEIETLESLINSVIDQTRTLTSDLSPPILYDLGLLPAIKWNLDRIGKMHKFLIRLKGEETVINLKSDYEILLYRVINELFNNIIKHSRAKKIIVEIGKENDLIYFVVEDDGIGFSITSLDDEIHEKQKFGLFSIRERLKYIQGSMKIHSLPGKGTRITLEVPNS